MTENANPEAETSEGDSSSTNEDTTSIRLEGNLDLRAANALFDTLKDKRGDAITIDCTDVEFIGAQALQVLLSAHQTWEADEIAFSVENPSSAFLENLDQLGLPHCAIIKTEEPACL